MIKKRIFVALFVFSSMMMNAWGSEFRLTLKSPGNDAETYVLKENTNGSLTADTNLPLSVTRRVEEQNSLTRIYLTLQATDRVYYNYEEIYSSGFNHDDCLFYMPGFWYRKNLRSPKEAPSFYTSDSWNVREDRLSTPLTGIYDEKSNQYYTVLRIDDFKEESQPCHLSGDVILSDKTSLGFTGFQNVGRKASLVFGFPYSEAPKTYIRKLTLVPAVRAFEKLEKGETRELVWEIKKGSSADYSGFVAEIWNYSVDTYQPQVVENQLSADEAKEIMTNYFMESYVDKFPLKFYSGERIMVDDCEANGRAEVGFVGRTLLNAFNALEYGEANNCPDLVAQANAIFDSYQEHGFTPPNGYIREFVNFDDNEETHALSIRRQSEGAFAVLNYLEYEKWKGRKHPEWEARINKLLGLFLTIQNEDGSFPRKFDDNSKIVDASGGSTPSATLPLTMAYAYFKNKTYLESAKKTAVYLENELILKADYFSSTLDANCEDKEASLYTSTAMYYLAMVSKGKEQQHYIDLSHKAAYFALLWYYTWDVPFAQGQMLGDVGFRSRGWGNVSVENNHIDVFIFEFATVLDWLAYERNEPRFSEFTAVIKTSMLQLMPVKGNMFNIAKVGYYPEVVQHTNWDYGRNGKGFYNDIFAPGWTVASLWQMLSPTRVEDYFNYKRK